MWFSLSASGDKTKAERSKGTALNEKGKEKANVWWHYQLAYVDKEKETLGFENSQKVYLFLYLYIKINNNTLDYEIIVTVIY